MKRLTITTLTILTIISTSYGQWNESTFIPSVSIFEIDFPAVNSAYITGDFGLLLKSTDAGISWKQIYDFGPFSSLNNVKFINADTGYVNVNGGVYRTFDGGISWSAISSNWGQSGSVPISHIKITNNKIFSTYVNNDTVYFLKSNDYGSSWDTVFQNYEIDAKLYRFSMVDTLNGYFVNPNELQQVLKTTDGGRSFSDTLFVTTGPIVLQAKYDFKDMQNGYWYGSSGSLSHPTRTWNTGTYYFPIDLDGFGVLPVLDLDFNTSKLYASSLYGKIFFSTNNGQNWTEQSAPTDDPVSSIAFVNENQGIAVTGGNKVLFTNNGGFLGVKDLSNLAASVNVYPNPASGDITIESTDLSIFKVTVMDIEGKTVEVINEPARKYNTKSLNAGTYFLYIETAKGSMIKKIIKK